MGRLRAVSIVIVLLALVGLFGWSSVVWRSAALDARMRENLLRQAVDIAGSIDTDLAKTLTFTPADRKSTAFERIRRQMVAYGRCIRQRNIHSLAIRNGALFFGPENLDPSDPVASPPGTLYEKPRPENWEVLRTGVARVIGPYTDEYGTFIGGFAPVIDPATGAIIMAIGLDVLIDEWAREVYLLTLPPILFSVVLTALVLSLALLFRWRHTLPKERRAKLRYVEIAAAVSFCLCMTAGIAYLVFESEQNERRQFLRQEAFLARMRIHGALTTVRENLALIARLSSGRAGITDQDLVGFVTSAVEKSCVRRCGILSLAMEDAPLGGERSMPGRARQRPVLTLRERGSDGMWHSVPAAELEAALVGSADEAARSGLPTAAVFVRPAAAGATESFYLYYCQPISGGGASTAGTVVASRPARFIFAEIAFLDLLESAIPNSRKDAIVNLALIDLGSPGRNRVLASYPADVVMAPGPLRVPHFSGMDLLRLQPLFFGGGSYALASYPSQYFYRSYPLYMCWLTVFSGLLVTVVLAVFVWFLQNRHVVMERLVDERTREVLAGKQMLEEVNRRLEYILGVTGTGVDVIDDRFNLLYVDRHWQKVYGDPAGRKCYEYFMGRDAACSGCGIPRALETHQITVTEETLPRENDRIVEVHTIPLLDEKGTWIVAEFNIDITERKRAEMRMRQMLEAFKESEARFRNLVETTSDWVWETDADGVCIYSNPKVMDILGYAPGEVLGKKPFDLMPPDEARRVGELFARLVSAKSPIKVLEYVVLHRDGRRVRLETNAIPLIASDGRLHGYRGVNRDITERKQLEELRLAKERAESVSKAKSAFLASMSHEIRTPMNAVIGFADLLAGTRLDAVQAEYLGTIRESGAMLLRIIDDILDMSKIEAGEIRLEQVDFDIRRLVENTAKSIQPRLEGKPVSLSVTCSENLPAAVRGDPVRVRQIVLNLLHNAVKFTEQGEIAVHLRLVGSGAERKVAITVRDTGIGIPREKHQTIFSAFAQADHTITRKYGGTGLGLTIVKDLCALMNGTVNVSSVPGKGSEFTVTLDLPRGLSTDGRGQIGEGGGAVSGQPADSVSAAARSLAGLRALVAEDDPVSQKLVKILLEKAGLVVDTVADGSEVIASVAAHAYDIIFMDIQMPVVDGIEAMRCIRGELKRDIPIVGLSAAAMQSEREAALHAGMHDYLIKPINADALMAILTKWCVR